MSKSYTATTKTGGKVKLYSDDTFTLAFAATRANPTTEETTAETLAECLPMTSLAKLFAAEPGEKIARAIIIAAQEVL